MTRFYSANATQTTLQNSCLATDLTIVVQATTGFPGAPFTLALDYGAAAQEVVLVTNVAGTTLTVTRGYDSTVAQPHNAGAVVAHTHTAQDFRDTQSHIAATSAHGIAGAVVGTTDAQALSNKDLSAGSNTFPATLATVAAVLSAAQALTNKDLSSGTNTFPASLATVAAMLSGVQTLTNKTLTSPVVNGQKADQINDTNGNAEIVLSPAPSAVNQVTVANAATGSAPALKATGTDTNIPLNLVSKGTGTVEANGVTVADLSSAQTLTGKSLDSPTIVGTSGLQGSGILNSVTNLTCGGTAGSAGYWVVNLGGLKIFWGKNTVSGATSYSLTIPAGVFNNVIQAEFVSGSAGVTAIQVISPTSVSLGTASTAATTVSVLLIGN